jgi:protein TonB
MNRYLKSFFIAVILYSCIAVIFLFSFDNKKQITKKDEELTKLNLNIMTIQKPKPIVKKEPIKKVKSKIENTKEVKKISKIINKSKPKIEPKKIIVKKEEPKQEILKKPIISQKIVQKEIQTKSIIKQKVKKEIPKKIDKSHLQNFYYSKIKENIEKYKKYPKSAIRRGIQSNIKVHFKITKFGKLINYEILEGKRIFYKSVKNSIENSFPIKIEEGVFTKDIDFDLTIKYVLNS